MEDSKLLTCPKCNKGIMLKGKSAYGCSRFREGCKFVIPFEVLDKDYKTKVLTNSILSKMV